LPGLGPRLGKLAEKLVGPFVVSLLWHLPCGVIDRRYAPRIAEAQDGRVATLTVTVDDHVPPLSKRHPFRVRCVDETGVIELTFFHARGDWLEKRYPIGRRIVISGKVDAVLPADEADKLESVEPVYPMTNGLPAKTLRKAVLKALELPPDLAEWQDPAWLARQTGWPGWREALRIAHHPDGEAALDPNTPVRRRLAYDELLANQLALALVRRHQAQLGGRSTAGDRRLRDKVQGALPYRLTGAQTLALSEIETDMASDKRMLRLLQGDVGSGKTIVALLAVEAGYEAALMAPTEILARQHAESLVPLAWRAGVEIGLLTGRDKGKARERILERAASGELPILIGT
ncbi:ATP-dependent DNA helicase RecG, partial [bacterium]|nr:ATP-dependent DNA helicase RecG [bacterium]